MGAQIHKVETSPSGQSSRVKFDEVIVMRVILSCAAKFFAIVAKMVDEVR